MLGLSQQQFGKMMGVTYQQVTKYEHRPEPHCGRSAL